MRTSHLAASVFALLALSTARDALAAPSLDAYRHFRALAIDLLGRVPSRAEIAAFEAPGFDMTAWVDAHLSGQAYADRVSRIYLDLLRLQMSPIVTMGNLPVALRRETVVGPDGHPMYVYFRFGQRRSRVETDGDFCLTPDETGLQFPNGGAPTVYPPGASRTTGTPVSQAVLDANTVLVKPWWLYSDYRSATPAARYDKTTWPSRYGFELASGLDVEPDGVTKVTAIRICKEEAQTTDTGHVFVTGRTGPLQADGGGPPFGRLSPVPFDDFFAKKHGGETISCRTSTGFLHAADCGCGKGLEHCTGSAGFNPLAAPTNFAPQRDVLGADNPVDDVQQSQAGWTQLWQAEEARHFFAYVFGQDRDFREVLTAPYSFVNGPLAHFYRADAPSTCCGNAAFLGYIEPKPLFDTAALPNDLLAYDTTTWRQVTSRSDLAAGILTMPIFLNKFGTRRSKAHVLYNAFLCKDFVAPPGLQLTPSTEPNLMIRQGCSACHSTLEPMSAYFSRVQEGSVTYLPKEFLPLDTTATCAVNPSAPQCVCKLDTHGNMNGVCSPYYDPAFSNTTHAVLRGAYPDAVGGTTHADMGPIGLSNELIAQPEFGSCVAENVASSFLGRPLTADDDNLKQQLTQAFTQSYSMRALVRATILSDAYKKSNNLVSSVGSK